MQANLFTYLDPEGKTQYGVYAPGLDYPLFSSPSLENLAKTFASERVAHAQGRPEPLSIVFAVPNQEVKVRRTCVSCSGVDRKARIRFLETYNAEMVRTLF